MDIHTKEIMNDYGYELWSPDDIDKDYKVSKEKVAKTHKALMEKRKSNLSRDVAAYELLVASKPDKPPCVKAI